MRKQADKYDARDAAAFSKGTHVRLCGLQKRPELNDAVGVTCVIKKDSTRIPVRLTLPASVVGLKVELKPENVERII